MLSFFKNFLIFIAIAWLAGCDHAKQNEEADKKAIQNVVQSYLEAYNQQDAVKLTAHWSSNATYINPVTGESAEGKEAIEKLFQIKFAQNKKTHLTNTIKSIVFPHTNEAIENGVMKVAVDDQPTRQMAYQAELVRENGKWLIKAINEIELYDAPSNFEQLKDLAWLVGKWKDSDGNVSILFDNQWDKYKNFIIQNFTMKIYGQDDIEGRQIIGWDPVKGVIRSWVFDSDGGFGEGKWEQENNSWYATMNFTLNGGRTASSINIYSPVDEHTYAFASVEREVDGEILPDMNPVTVEKVD